MSEKATTKETIVSARRRRWALAGAAAGTLVATTFGVVACSGAGTDDSSDYVDKDKEQVTADTAVSDTSAPTDATANTTSPSTAPRLDPNRIPKFVNQFVRLPTYKPTVVKDSTGKIVLKQFNISIAKFFDQQLPSPFPKTLLFGYGSQVKVGSNCPLTEENLNKVAAAGNCASVFQRSSPGPTFEQTRLIPAQITYNNQLADGHPLPVDPTLDWANPNNFPKPTPPFRPFPPGYPQAQSPIPHVTHTHGIEVRPEFDGTPDLWFTPNGIVGPEFVSRTYTQPSSNQSAAFWYHDHSFGITRLDVGMGLSGFSILRDPAERLDNPPAGTPDVLPRGEFEVPMIIQDRSYRTDGSVFYPVAQQSDPTAPGVVPDVHPYWVLLNDQDTILVNGRVWPNMDVKRALYRFRILNSANQRFFQLHFANNMPFRVIGSDGGYIRSAQTVTDALIGVTERTDLLVDFRSFPAGTKIVLQNISQRNPPVGPAPDPNNDGLIMQFTVKDPQVAPPAPLPATLRTIPTLTPDRPTRLLIQNVQTDDAGRILQAELDGQLFHELTTELPTIGATEDWEFINTTPLTHNKHVHLIQFLVVDRRNIDFARYLADWRTVNGNPPFDHPTLKLPIEPYVTGEPEGPRPEESGWKDTIRTPAGQVTRLRVRWAIQNPQSGSLLGINTFPINPINGVGFIWHCHLLEHEDNEMMRPLTVIPFWKQNTSYPRENRNSPGTQQGLVDFNGVDYGARVANFSTQPPTQRPDLWERINNQNGDWAIQIIYAVGDRVFFQGNVYRALQRHQARAGLEPNAAPAFWALVGPIP
jgi:FtsP/CotA-like multicopper oxidase with cupredoxin domain